MTVCGSAATVSMECAWAAGHPCSGMIVLPPCILCFRLRNDIRDDNLPSRGGMGACAEGGLDGVGLVDVLGGAADVVGGAADVVGGAADVVGGAADVLGGAVDVVAAEVVGGAVAVVEGEAVVVGGAADVVGGAEPARGECYI